MPALKKLLESMLTPPQQDGEKRSTMRLSLAVCTVLLEIAYADDEFSPEEEEHIIDTLRDRFDLTGEEADELVELAGRERKESLDVFQFTHRINESLSRDEKWEVMVEIWRVIYADGTLDAHEDYLVHKLARLLNLSHSELIEAKLAAIEESKED